MTTRHTDPSALGQRPRLDDPALLLGLTLAVSAALEPAEDGRTFLNALRDRTGLEAAVWTREGDRLMLDSASERLAPATTLPLDHPLAEAARNAEVVAAELPDGRFGEALGGAEGSAVAFRLGPLGLMALCAPADDPLASAEIEAVRPVLEHFAAHHRAGRRHERLRAEVAAGVDVWAARMRLLDDLAAEPSRSPREQIQRALELTTDLLGLDIGILSRVEAEAGEVGGVYIVEACQAPGTDLAPGQQFALRQTYCSITLENGGVVAIDHMGEGEHRTHPCYEAFQLESYIGIPVYLRGRLFGTLNFSSAEPKRPSFTEADRDLLRLLAPWVASALEQERAAAALSNTKARMERMLTAAPDAFVYAGTDRIIKLVNPSFERVFGWTQAEVIGRHTQFLYADAEDYAEQGRRRFNLAAGESLEPYLVRYRRRDGSTFLGETVGASVEDEAGRRIGFLGFVRDVTAREAAQAAAAAEKAHYESLVEVAADLIYRADARGYFTYVNPVALQRLGYREEDVLGHHFTELVRPDARARVLAFYKRQMRDGRPTTYFEFPVANKEGREMWVGQNVQIVREGDDGRVTGVQAVARDITAQKRLEEELREAMEAAEASAHAKERFLATMSHEIRTPLNAVTGLAHLLDTTSLSSEQSEYVHGITTAADALLGLVNDVLDFARIGADKLSFEAVPFRPADIVSDLVRLYRPHAEAKGLSLRFSLDAVPGELVGDPHRLRQILLNLVSNAVKFTEVGGVDLRVRPSIKGQDGPVVLLFEVSDSGIGIAPAQREQIFEAFTQARTDAARKYGGTGLGLAIVRELVERQGGAVTLESELGRGSTFTVTLPFACASVLPAASDADGEDADLSGVHVLLAEDVPMNRLVAVRTLARWGVETTVAKNGREAVRLAAADPDAFDLVLMDLQMPEMDGIAATQYLRGELGLSQAQLPIVALTASVLAAQRDDVLAAGFDEFVLKPFEPAALRRCIAGLVGRGETAAPELVGVNRTILERHALGDAGLVAELAALFCRDVPGQIAALVEAVKAGERARVRALAHRAKSQAAYVGAEELSKVLVNVERGAENIDGSVVAEVERADRLCQRVVYELQAVGVDCAAAS